MKYYRVSSFTENPFLGNPAGVCLLDDPISESLMQDIASENNLSETAFVLKKAKGYEIRWFTPTTEIDLCGHATLASAFVLFKKVLDVGCKEIDFWSPRSGVLKTYYDANSDCIVLDFPIDAPKLCEVKRDYMDLISENPIEIYKASSCLILVLKNKGIIEEAIPNLEKIKEIKTSLVITSKDETVDFVSRCFTPYFGVDEDPVTGSVHCALYPLWRKKLSKNRLKAKQVSKRGGYLECYSEDNQSVMISGNAVIYQSGEINI